MAGDWIKFESTTPDKPEVVRIAAQLGIDQDAVVGKLMRLWVWADQNSVDGNGVTVTSSFLDRITFCPNFAQAMRDVGWLLGTDGSLTLPNFDRHNGKTAKERAVSNRRVKKHRSGNGESNGSETVDVTPTPLQKPLPEKRREEKKEQEPTPTPNGAAESAMLAAYHAALPNCQRINVLNPKRRKRIAEVCKLARSVCASQGWEYAPDTFWSAYFAECARDPWMRGDLPNPKNPGWKQNLDVLIREDRFAGIMDRAIAAARSAP